MLPGSLKVCSLFSKEGGRYNNVIHNTINECKMCRHFGILTLKDVSFNMYASQMPITTVVYSVSCVMYVLSYVYKISRQISE